MCSKNLRGYIADYLRSSFAEEESSDDYTAITLNISISFKVITSIRVSNVYYLFSHFHLSLPFVSQENTALLSINSLIMTEQPTTKIASNGHKKAALSCNTQ
jgi:hypothetical protein